MKLIKILIFLASIAYTQPSWYPPEKYQPALHFSISTAFCLATFYTWELISPSYGFKQRSTKLWWSVPIAVMPGLAKEFFDRSKNKFFNREDMYYDIIGAWTGGALIWIIHF